MGQYGDQPDFGTRANYVVPTDVPGAALVDLENLKSAALYIGTGGTLVCSVVGGIVCGGCACRVFLFPCKISQIIKRYLRLLHCR